MGIGVEWKRMPNKPLSSAATSGGTGATIPAPTGYPAPNVSTSTAPPPKGTASQGNPAFRMMGTFNQSCHGLIRKLTVY